MMFRFLSPAKSELADAVDYYHAAVPGLGLEFLDEVDAAIARILRQPEAWVRISDSHRRCRLRRFPYGLIYIIDGEEILITAVMHLRRHPDLWKGRT